MTKRKKLKISIYIVSFVIIIMAILIIIFNHKMKSQKLETNSYFSYEEFAQYRDMIKFSNQINIVFLLSTLFLLLLIAILTFYISRTCQSCENGKLILKSKDLTSTRNEDYKKDIPIKRVVNTKTGRGLTVYTPVLKTKRIRDIQATYVCDICGKTTIKETSRSENI